jgi:hypothetical protein
MSDQGVQRKARITPERELEIEDNADQLDLLDNVEETLSPEDQADEHKRLIEDLRKQNEEATKRVSQAEEAMRAERVQREEAQKGAFFAQERAVENQIESTKRMIEQAKMSLRAAREAGDFDAEEAALDALTDAKANMVTLSQQRQYVEALKKNGPPQPAQQQQQQVYRGPHGFSKASEDWISQHPQFDTDPEFKTTVLQAAQAALTQHAPDSYQFFKFLDDVVVKRYGNNNMNNKSQNQNNTRRGPLASSVAASPSREAARRESSNGVNANAVANKLGVSLTDLEQFAKIARMKFDDYVAEQALIIEEERRGIDTGLYRGDSR